MIKRALSISYVTLAACGGLTTSPVEGDAASSMTHASSAPRPDARAPTQDATVNAPPDTHDATSAADALPLDFDVGVYRGDGAFFVDGGRRVDSTTNPSDASSVGADAAEPISILTSGFPWAINDLVSDGSTLFWTTATDSGIWAMPVRGGPIRRVVIGGTPNTDSERQPQIITVDAVNLYIFDQQTVVRLPKDGSPPTNMSGDATVWCTTALGPDIYWSGVDGPRDNIVESAPLLGGPVTEIARFTTPMGDPSDQFPVGPMGVTDQTVFLADGPLSITYFPRSSATGPPLTNDGGIEAQIARGCGSMTSDTEAVYCTGFGVLNVALQNDGTPLTLSEDGAPATSIVFDRSYVYWASVDGTIVRVPKRGGGSTVLATDTTNYLAVMAIAIDSHSIYWANQGGFIQSIPRLP